MSPADIKIGMYFVNDGTTAVPVYDNLDGSGSSPMLKVQPGQLIGQVADIKSGQGGTVLNFISDDITKSANIFERATVFIVGWLLDDVKVGGAVRWSDFASHVSEAQVQEQAAAIATAEANGMSLGNMIKTAAKKVGEGITSVVTGVIPWGAVGLFVVAWLAYQNRSSFISKKSKATAGIIKFKHK